MMYPFSNICNYNPITYSGQGIPHRPFLNDDTCFITKLEDSSSLFHLLSPYMHYEDEAVILQDLHNLELQQQPLTTENTIADTATNMGDSGKKNVSNEPKEGCSKECNSTAEQIARKKSSKKDRHSKINTAHGPRDRRMRLSLDVARKFFDLQDMLGFDKASKTVEWLLTKSRSAIKELSSSSCAVGAYSASSTSECEVISGLNQSANNQQACANRKGKPSGTKEKKKIKAARRIPFHPFAKKSREKARERARERTKEKIRRLSESKLQIGAVGHALNRLGSSSSVETGEESGSQGHVKKPSYEMLAEEEELSPHERQLAGTEENISNDSLVVTDNWSPSTIFNFQQNAGASNGHQFEEFQFYGKSWESYSNMKL